MTRRLSAAEHGESIFEALLDTAPDATVVVDDDGVIVFASLQTERVFGYAREELIDQPVEVLIPERYRATHTGHRKRFATDARVRPMGSGLALFGLKRNGEEFPIEISLSPVSRDGRTWVSAAIRDITDRKRAEEEAQRLQNHLLSAVESIRGAFAIFDRDDRLVLCNSSYRVIWGAALRGPMIGMSFEALLDERLASGMFDYGELSPEAYRARWLAYHRDPEGTLDLKMRDGRSLRFSARRTLDQGTVKTVLDITEDVSREEELRQTRAAAEAASSAKSEFLASMSHELRTPLNAILGFAQLLYRDKKEPLSERHRERIEHVLKGGEHLLRLIDDILDLSRIEAGRVPVSLEPVAVDEVLADVQTTLAPMGQRADTTLSIETPSAELPRVLADRTRFKQVLMNFGSNAIKYGRAGGCATFRASVEGKCIRVTVTDDGMGIPEDKQDKIFSPFQRAGQETGPIEGTGIGLAITKRLAELMNGSVGFQSVHGQGSTFWIELPIHHAATTPQAATERSATTHEALTTPREQRHLVVYIEDNPSNIAFMSDLISDFDAVELVTAPSAEIGIELVRARLPRVVIMDIHLPGMSGLEATRQLRAWPETRDIPVVALSAAAMVRDAEQIRAAGFHRYLTKPVKVDELATVLEELLRR